ncbi:MAG: TIGR03960 family B12-binding radical SAM protein [Christensenellaceae bacterium]|jgi:radical SAM family uncharacterized protein|nr:TIGR03960 family B12-binding radical SAM protein [Christensenellaceae bacterium]
MSRLEFEDILYTVEKPGRYVGGEYNVPDMTKPHKVDFCMVFPDLYEIGMSNLGVKILYGILNEMEDVVCQRCFAPAKDFGLAIKQNGIPLMSIETKKPLIEFDAIGFSVQYELSYTNIPYMLDLAGFPYYAKDRDDTYPILMAGGPCSANPEPYADFFDIVCIGDGEDLIVELAKILIAHKNNKAKIIESASRLDGVYAPQRMKVVDGITTGHVKKAVIQNLDTAYYPINPIVSNVESVHDRPVVELFRGCYAGCRFCQACFIYRPMRMRSEDTVVAISEALINNTGTEELGYSSLSTGDYPYIKGALRRVSKLAAQKRVKMQLPSLRLDSFSDEITEWASKASLTFAPEAGTQRLRNVINKNITDEDIDRTMSNAFKGGYTSVKLYFMIGLPTETDEDVLGIAETVRHIKDIYFQATGRGGLTASVSCAVFIPKPITPFQWVAQITVPEMERRQKLLRDALRKIKGVSFSWLEPSMAYLEGIFARGGRELSALIIKAYENGALFDGWTDEYKYDIWAKSIQECGLNVDKYVSGMALSAILPWDFIDFGITKSFLEKEYRLALEAKTSDGCKFGCAGCGASVYAKCQIQER